MNNSEKLPSCWLKVSIIADPVLTDAISDYLEGITGAGVEIVVDGNLPHTKINAFLEKRNPDESEVKQILTQIAGYARELAEIFQAPVPEIESSVIKEEDWGTTWKEHFKPFAIIPGLVIKPSWEEYLPGIGEQIIEMDPGMAFGTGHHATTALSLELLRAVLPDMVAARVLDVGTGTGILGMAATLFGADRVLGIDNDPEAIAAASKNVSRNGLGAKMSVSLASPSTLTGSFSIVVANIIHNVLLELSDHLDRLTADGGRLILSGILTGEQADALIKHFSARSLHLVTHLQKKEWSALLFEKSSRPLG